MFRKGWLVGVVLCLFLGGLYYASSQPYEKQDIRSLIRTYVNLDQVEKNFWNVEFSYGSKIISIEKLGSDNFVEFFVRKAAHILTFAGLSAILYILFRCWLAPSAAIPWSGFIALLCALLDEFHQSFTPRRTGQIIDVVLDSSGIIIVLFIIVIWKVFHTSISRAS